MTLPRPPTQRPPTSRQSLRYFALGTLAELTLSPSFFFKPRYRDDPNVPLTSSNEGSPSKRQPGDFHFSGSICNSLNNCDEDSCRHQPSSQPSDPSDHGSAISRQSLSYIQRSNFSDHSDHSSAISRQSPGYTAIAEYSLFSQTPGLASTQGPSLASNRGASLHKGKHSFSNSNSAVVASTALNRCRTPTQSHAVLVPQSHAVLVPGCWTAGKPTCKSGRDGLIHERTPAATDVSTTTHEETANTAAPEHLLNMLPCSHDPGPSCCKKALFLPATDNATAALVSDNYRDGISKQRESAPLLSVAEYDIATLNDAASDGINRASMRHQKCPKASPSVGSTTSGYTRHRTPEAGTPVITHITDDTDSRVANLSLNTLMSSCQHYSASQKYSHVCPQRFSPTSNFTRSHSARDHCCYHCEVLAIHCYEAQKYQCLSESSKDRLNDVAVVSGYTRHKAPEAGMPTTVPDDRPYVCRLPDNNI